jgi:hypothetical protein
MRKRQLRAAHLIESRRELGTLGTSQPCIKDGVSMPDNSMTGTFQVNLPKDLLSEAKRATKTKGDQLHVEGWRNSWLSRLAEKLVGKD